MDFFDNTKTNKILIEEAWSKPEEFNEYLKK